VIIEHRYAQSERQLPELAAEFVRLEPNVLVTGGSAAIRPLQRATATIPVVIVADNVDPVAAGYVSSYAHPGGNLTGLTGLSPEVTAKRMELLKEAVPGMTRVAVLQSEQPRPRNSLGGNVGSRPHSWASMAGARHYRRRPDRSAVRGGNPRPRRRSGGDTGPAHEHAAASNYRAGGPASTAGDVRNSRVRGRRGADGLRSERVRLIPAHGGLRGSNPEGDESRRATCRTGAAAGNWS
jgi:hypothetical protein